MPWRSGWHPFCPSARQGFSTGARQPARRADGFVYALLEGPGIFGSTEIRRHGRIGVSLWEGAISSMDSSSRRHAMRPLLTT
jgi:hypothetical protein